MQGKRDVGFCLLEMAATRAATEWDRNFVVSWDCARIRMVYKLNKRARLATLMKRKSLRGWLENATGSC